MNIILCILGGILIALGVSELVRLLVFWCLRPDTSGTFTMVVKPQGAEDCEYALRTAAERIKWMDMKGACRLICVTEEKSDEVEKICRFFSLTHPYLVVSKPEDLVYNILEQEFD